MVQQYHDSSTNGTFIMVSNETNWQQNYFRQKKGFSSHTIAWNRGQAARVWIDEIPVVMDTNTVLPIMLNQSFRFEDASNIVGWQFDRNFYCLQNHDAEVGCYGFLFFGPLPTMVVNLGEDGRRQMEELYIQVIDEFNSSEPVKAGMLRALLVRLIIQLTRIARKQYFQPELNEQNFNLLRQFNFLVELHYKQQHQVGFYANALNRSAKTISNIFSLNSSRSPLQIIHDRIITEAKRLMLYTDRSVKEIAFQLGFEDATHFSKFFKNQTGQTPSEFKKH